MRRSRGWTLGRIRGIPLVIDYSWPVIAVLITWSLFVDFRLGIDDLSGEAALLLAAVGSLAFFGSVLVHELSHSVLAVRRGLTVRRIRLFIFGGVSEIESEATSARDEFAIAIAGPLSSMAMAFGFVFLAYVAPASWEAVDRLLRLLGYVNAALALFNLVPGFPLDGGRVLRALIWRVSGDRRRASSIAVGVGKGVAVLLMAVGGVLFFRDAGDGQGLAGFWYIAIGGFLYWAAEQHSMQYRALAKLEGVTAANLMSASSAAVPGELTVRELLGLYVTPGRPMVFPVVVGGRVRGLISTERASAVPAADRASIPVASVMDVLGPDDVVDVSTTAEDLVGRFERPEQRMAVVSAGRFVGTISPADLSRYLTSGRV